jgi:hypothetical protein
MQRKFNMETDYYDNREDQDKDDYCGQCGRPWDNCICDEEDYD